MDGRSHDPQLGFTKFDFSHQFGFVVVNLPKGFRK
jgi:hypothetical protein